MITFYVETVGCQMNVLDSELITASLLREGFRPVENHKLADIVLYNTCSIRQHAEDKIYSALGRLKNVKKYHPQKIFGVMGCMAQKDGAQIFARAPHVDFVVGPGQIALIPHMIARVRQGETQLIELSLDRRGRNRHEVEDSFDFFDPMRDLPARESKFQAMVRVMFGCDQFCTYCIVPRVRGPEQSRAVHEILSEVEQLASQGCREVTLIGQTVSKYRDENGKRLSDLLEKVEKIAERSSLARIRFVTSHPTSMTPDLLAAVRDLPHVMPYFHVPAQSGSDSVLKRMNRGYSVARYREMLDEIHETVPGAAVTSDFIVGFCGETDADFEQTMQLTEDARFKNSFIFKFSPREGTKAYELFADDVPEEVKKRRNNALLAVQNRISEEDNRAFLGQEVEILVEGASKNAKRLPIFGRDSDADAPTQMTGRTPCDRIVVFDGGEDLAGTLQRVKIVKTGAFTLFGEMISELKNCEKCKE